MITNISADIFSLAINDTVCLNYAQMNFIGNEVFGQLYQYGLFMLVMGLIFGFVFGWLVKRDWS